MEREKERVEACVPQYSSQRKLIVEEASDTLPEHDSFKENVENANIGVVATKVAPEIVTSIKPYAGVFITLSGYT